ncbi:MAG: hypothetical protein ACXWDI_01430 [Nocardioides sp.]
MPGGASPTCSVSRNVNGAVAWPRACSTRLEPVEHAALHAEQPDRLVGRYCWPLADSG